MTLAQLLDARSIPEPNSGCVLWLGPERGGYGVVYDKCQHRQIGAHRLAFELKNGPVPKGLFACHKCDVKFCINPEHIFIGTAKDNSEDLVKKGLSKKGHAPYNAKLTSNTVLKIRDDSRTYSEISESFGVSRGSISAIKSGAQWSRVTGTSRQEYLQPKKSCAYGHPWIAENIGFAKSKPAGYCKVCNRTRAMAHHTAKKQRRSF